MASWALNGTPSFGKGPRQPAILDGKLYWIDSLLSGNGKPSGTPFGDVVEWDPSGPTQTTIFDISATTDPYRTWSLAVFKGDLYIAAELDHGGTIEVVVLRWDGTPGSWTEVYSTGTAVVNDNYVRLYADDSQMVYMGYFRPGDCNPGSLYTVAYTSDGSSWSAGTMSPIFGENSGGWGSIRDNTVYWPLGFYDYVCIDTDDCSSSACVDADIVGWGGSSFGTFQSSPAQIFTQSSPNGNVHFGGNDGNYKISGDMSAAAQIDIDIHCAYLLASLPFAVGVETGTGETLLYYFDGSNSWVSLETISGPEFSGLSTYIGNISVSAGIMLAFNNDTNNWEVWDRDEPFSLTTETRHLGLATDQANLYLTVNDAGTLKCLAYNLETLTLVNTASLGAATFVEVEDRDRGIFPVVKPGEDGVVFLRGRDGNNVAVQRSDDGGASFSDVDDGGWGTTKYAVGLLIDPLHPDDLVAVFDDDDLYQSVDAGDTWTKIADAPGTLRAAGRHLIDARRLMLATQAADTIHFTPNLGLTTEDVSDAALNTINVIEVSR